MTSRSHEFAWLGGPEPRETLLFTMKPLRIGPSSELFGAVQKMHATATLNPYERDLLCGYPYLVGRLDRDTATLDGRLVPPPSEPRGSEQGIWLVDQAALFVAPKTSYFITNDLDHIGTATADSGNTALASLIGRPGGDEQFDLDVSQIDRAHLYFPFPSNRAQRRAALLAEDETSRVVRVEGPPGTGKSLTIANLSCHLAAVGKTVPICSQKDKALEVVDAKLRELGMTELPMTLLHRDRDSKRELLRRLERVKKERSRAEVEGAFDRVAQAFAAEIDLLAGDAERFASAIMAEEAIERAHLAALEAKGLRRVTRQMRLWYTRWKSTQRSPAATDDVAAVASQRRQHLLKSGVEALQLGRELAIAKATRDERASIRDLASVLKRDQTRYKNFSASQVDLPSIAPVAYRGKKLLVFGDSQQMQPRRFAFASQDATTQAWQQHRMDQLDPERRLHPSEQSLLLLSNRAAGEEALLDEHFRSLPPIIQFSNKTWYGERLRVMTDERRKRYGGPTQPIMELHRVEDGIVSNGSQENEAEAAAVECGFHACQGRDTRLPLGASRGVYVRPRTRKPAE